MKKIILFICTIMMLTFPSFSQEIKENKPEKPEKSGPDGTVLFQPVKKGDKYLRIGLSLGVPMFNTSREQFAIKPNIYPGGSIDLGFGYYVLNGFSLGATLSFQFYPSIQKNIYFAVPFTFDMAYTFAKGKWRIPLGIGIGTAFQSYNGNGGKYFGMLFRPEAGVYYQYSPEWSFGGNVSWLVLPQWYKETKNNRVGNVLNISFAARYHF